MDEFTISYITCMLWAETDDNEEPFDRNYTQKDIAPEAIEIIKKDCARFQEENAADLQLLQQLKVNNQWDVPAGCTVLEYAGHDFWLTRNGHGANFLDGDYPEEIAERLYDSAKKHGEVNIYLADDGLIYSM